MIYNERPNRSKAEFRALRELAGLSQNDLAQALDVKPLSIVRWESPGYEQKAPADAWYILDAAIVEQRRVVDRIITATENAAEVVPEPDSLVIFLPYYPSELDYNGGGSWKCVNANLRAAYAVLVELGFTVEWTDATDERAFKYVD